MKRLFIAVLMIFTIKTAFAQIITTAEYFIDTDPGPGNGTPVSVGTQGIVVSFPIAISANLSPGFHWLGVRAKDSDGKWGLFERRSFYISQTVTDLPIITQAEYFFDSDPGPGYGTQLAIQSPGFSIGQNFAITVPANMSAGTHRLAIRVKDQAGHWSLFQKDSIVVGGATTISCPQNVTVSAATGQCSAIVNNIDPNVSPQGSSYTYTLTGATTGSGTGTASGKTFNTGVTTVTYAINNTPSISCSFSVTVNSNTTSSVSIDASASTICSGQSVTFTATHVNGGNTPSYQWKRNGNNIAGATNSTYQSSSLTDGDNITVSMTSSIGCANPQTVSSNAITMYVSSIVAPWVGLGSSATTICAGTPVNYIAMPTNGGSSPTYQWKRNGNTIPGVSGPTYQTSALANGDIISVVMTSSLSCASPQTYTNSMPPITVTQTLPAGVILEPSATTICEGASVNIYANPVNGGNNPSYQWKVNGINTGTNSYIFSSSSLNNGDVVTVVMTSSLGCASPQSATSSPLMMTVIASPTPSVSIDASATNICASQLVTFTANPVSAGNNITYQWTLNDNVVGSNSSTYQTDGLENDDKIKVKMTSQVCAGTSQVFSNIITMTVGGDVTPSVTISSVNSTGCSGTLAIFHASPISGAGSSPSYQWKRNGVDIPGATNSTYQSSSLQNGDVIRAAMTSSLACANPKTVLSHDSAIMVISSVPLTPSVSISASATAICQGQTVLFTALPTNGGDVPGYQWKLNGISVGDNIDTFSTSTLNNGDMVTVEMFTSVPCAISPTATSSPVSLIVTTLSIYYADFDGDGYGNGASGVTEACAAPAGYVTNNSDCNDDNAFIHPGRTEICGNGIDDDCDGQIDEACGSPDNDSDGYTIAQGDCNDNNPSVHPGAIEVCENGIDDNCNGQIDEGCTQELPTLMTRAYPAKEGDAGLTTLNVVVSLDIPAPLPVSVKYRTINEDAVGGTDYESTSGTLIIPAGKSSGSIQVKIIGDLLREHNERFRINFSDPVNVLLPADPDDRVMIIDDDKGKPTTNSAAMHGELVPEEAPFKIPTVARRNQVWMIPQIGNYENEILIVNVQGQVISIFINYQNQIPLSNVSTGLYFYKIRVKGNSGQYKFYSGRLLITE